MGSRRKPHLPLRLGPWWVEWELPRKGMEDDRELESRSNCTNNISKRSQLDLLVLYLSF